MPTPLRYTLRKRDDPFSISRRLYGSQDNFNVVNRAMAGRPYAAGTRIRLPGTSQPDRWRQTAQGYERTSQAQRWLNTRGQLQRTRQSQVDRWLGIEPQEIKRGSKGEVGKARGLRTLYGPAGPTHTPVGYRYPYTGQPVRARPTLGRTERGPLHVPQGYRYPGTQTYSYTLPEEEPVIEPGYGGGLGSGFGYPRRGGGGGYTPPNYSGGRGVFGDRYRPVSSQGGTLPGGRRPYLDPMNQNLSGLVTWRL